MVIIECPENKGIKTAAVCGNPLIFAIIECPENKGIKTSGVAGCWVRLMRLSNALKTKGLRPGQVIRYR